MADMTQDEQPAMSMANGQIGNAEGQQLSPAHQAVIDGLTKGLNKGMENLAVTNPMAGVALLHSITQPKIQQMQQNQGQPMGTNQVNNPNILTPQNPMQNTAYNPQTGQIQEGGWVNRGLRGLASGGLPGALQGLLGPSLGAQMGATKEAQVLKAGQPSEIAEPQARASLATSSGKQIEQQIAGLTPKEQADFDVAMAQGKRETQNQYMQRLDDTIKAHQDYQETLVKNTNFIGRGDKMKQNEAMINLLQKQRDKIVTSNAMSTGGSPFDNKKSSLVNKINSKTPSGVSFSYSKG